MLTRICIYSVSAEDCAEYFDPLNPEDIGAAVLSVIEDEKLHQRLIASRRERVKFFSWDKTARETLEYYKEAMTHD